MEIKKSENDVIKFMNDYGIVHNHHCKLYLIDTYYGITLSDLSLFNKSQEYIVLVECENEIFSFGRVKYRELKLDKDLMYDTWYNQNGTIIHAEKTDYNRSIGKWNNYVHNITLKNDNINKLIDKI